MMFFLLPCCEQDISPVFSTISIRIEEKDPYMGCQVGKKGLCARYMCIIFSSLGIIFCHMAIIQLDRSIISSLTGIILFDTSTISCDMPIFLSVVFIIHSAILSIFRLIGIVSLILQPLFPLLYSLIHVLCFEFPVSGALFSL